MYLAPLVVLAAAVVGIASVWGLHRITAVSSEPLVVLPFQSGWRPQEHALSRYHARWYLATLTFLAFDVEMLFMYPWAVVVADRGASAVIEMFVFLGALLLAVVWAWREGALRWV
ncbi:NADH-quinone oxidoreductase subunit A [Dermatophilaceae bacterium Sec6.4]